MTATPTVLPAAAATKTATTLVMTATSVTMPATSPTATATTVTMIATPAKTYQRQFHLPHLQWPLRRLL